MQLKTSKQPNGGDDDYSKEYADVNTIRNTFVDHALRVVPLIIPPLDQYHIPLTKLYLGIMEPKFTTMESSKNL